MITLKMSGYWILSVFLCVAQADPTVIKRDQLTDLHTLLREIDTHYGHSDFKRRHYGQTLDHLCHKYSNLIQNSETLEEALGWEPPGTREVLSRSEFQQLMIGLAAEFRDGHVNAFRQNKNWATLGLRTAVIEGRLFITGFLDPIFLPQQFTAPLRVGDEVVAVDGAPVEQLARRRMIYAVGGSFDSRWRYALRSVLEFPYAVFRPIKEGTAVELTLRRRGQPIVGRLAWVERQGYDVVKQLFFRDLKDDSLAPVEDREVPFGSMGTVRSYFRQGLLNLNLPEGSIVELGELFNHHLPEGIKPVHRLLATLVRYRGKNIGVLRIPSFSPPEGGASAENEMRWLTKIMPRLQNMTDVLILDTLGNSGGLVQSAMRVTSLFAEGAPIPTLSMNMRLSESLVETFRPTGRAKNDQAPNYSDWRLQENYYQSLRQKLDRGDRWSGFYPKFSYGVETDENKTGYLFAPGATAYKNPVLVANDSLSGSSGDTVAAMLQASQRALIFGETSQGYGGPVYRDVAALTGAELYFRCTMGECLRIDQLPIENIGVPPDLPRYVTPEDLTDGFRDYARDLLGAAVAVAAGQDRSQMQKALGVRSILQAYPSAAVKKLREVARFFASQAQNIVSLVAWCHWVERRAAAVLQAAQQLEPGDWRHVTLILPQPLLDHDLILSSLWRREEVIERLQDLSVLDKITSQPELAKLVKATLDFALKLPGPARMADPCDLALSAHAKPLVRPADTGP